MVFCGTILQLGVCFSKNEKDKKKKRFQGDFSPFQ
jgi:hypothetical protein